MIIFNAMSKGGVGKSYSAKLHSLKADKNQAETYFLDCDNASASLTKFFKGIEDRKQSFVKFGSYNLLGSDKKIDRTKFDMFLSMIAELPNVVVDFGAASSEQLIYYIQEEASNGIINTLKELDIKILLVIAGGGSIKECVEFFNEANKIEGMRQITHLVANEFLGGVNGKTVKEFTNAKIQITKLHEDANSEAQREWDKLMNEGVVYSDILTMNVIRRRRITNYLDNTFKQFDEL